MYNDIIKFVKQEKTTNEYGDAEIIESEREVLAQIKSIGQKEFYQAQAVGFKPEIKFVIADYLDYQGEQYLKYTENNKEEKYSIIRTFRTGIELEIICEKGID